jgi:putative endonuclease
VDRIPMKMQPPGAQAETRVSSLLQRQGWQLLDRNWSCRWGELDLVLHKNEQLLVVEVKGRRSLAWGPWSVDPTKRRRLGRAISCWRAEHPMQADWLLQVAVAVVPLPPSQGAPRWYRLDRLC